MEINELYFNGKMYYAYSKVLDIISDAINDDSIRKNN